MDRKGIEKVYSFEYDDHKSAANLGKHGIDFVDAQNIWKDDNAIEFELRNKTESRWGASGKIANKYWTAIITRRNDCRIRIISVRRARRNEIATYEITRHEQKEDKQHHS